jgi:hypothetical protein
MEPHTKRLIAVLLALAAPAVYCIGVLSQPPGAPNPLATPVVPLCLAIAAILLALSLKVWQSLPRHPRSMRRPQFHKHDPVKVAHMLLVQIEYYLDAPLAPGEFLAELNAATNGNPQLYTVSHLEAFMLQRVDGKTHQFPLLRPAFRRVRDTLTNTLKIPSRQIRPSAPLADLFPKSNRLQFWKSFHSQLGIPTPTLENSYFIHWLEMVSVVPFFCVLGLGGESLDPNSHVASQAWRSSPWAWAIIAILVAACLVISWKLTWILRKLGFRLETELPAYPRTVADLVRHLADGPLSTSLTWDHPLVHRVVQKILGSNLTPKTRLADLGLSMEFFTTPTKS